MVKYSLEIKQSAHKELDALDDELFTRIDLKIQGAGRESRPAGSKKLKGYKDQWRVRAGDWRVLKWACLVSLCRPDGDVRRGAGAPPYAIARQSGRRRGLARAAKEPEVPARDACNGRNACVALRVNDADGCYREWRSRVDVLRPPKNEDWGARTFDLLDPSGNTIFVMGT